MNITRKTINFLCDAYLCLNLGDDMFVEYLTEKFPQVSFCVLVHPKYAKPFKRIKNIKLHYLLWFFNKLLKKIIKKSLIKYRIVKKIKNYVYIGGSVFIEPENYEKDEILQYENGFILGANFGPYRNQKFYDLTKEKIIKLKDICFRDSYSYDMFKMLNNVRCAPDVLFGYNKYPAYQKGSGIGISVVELERRKSLSDMTEDYYKTIADFIEICCQQNITVSLYSFCSSEGDSRAVKKITELCQAQCRVVSYKGDIVAFLNDMNTNEYIVATRFHAMVIGWCLGKKVFPITYSKKLNNVMHDVNFTGKYWNLLKKEKYDAQRLFEDCLTAEPLQGCNDLQKKSDEQFKKITEFICAQ